MNQRRAGNESNFKNYARDDVGKRKDFSCVVLSRSSCEELLWVFDSGSAARCCSHKSCSMRLIFSATARLMK